MTKKIKKQQQTGQRRRRRPLLAFAPQEGGDSLAAVFDVPKQAYQIGDGSSSEESQEEEYCDDVVDSLAVVVARKPGRNKKKSTKKLWRSRSNSNKRTLANRKITTTEQFPRATSTSGVCVSSSSVLMDLDANHEGATAILSAKSSLKARRGPPRKTNARRVKSSAADDGLVLSEYSSLFNGLSLEDNNNEPRPSSRATTTTARRTTQQQQQQQASDKAQPQQQSLTGLSALFGASPDTSSDDASLNDDTTTTTASNEIRFGHALTLGYAKAGRNLPKTTSRISTRTTKRTALNKKGLRRSTRAAATSTGTTTALTAVSNANNSDSNVKQPSPQSKQRAAVAESEFGGLGAFALEPFALSSTEKSKTSRNNDNNNNMRSTCKTSHSSGSKHKPVEEQEHQHNDNQGNSFIVDDANGDLLAAFGDLSMNNKSTATKGQEVEDESTSTSSPITKFVKWDHLLQENEDSVLTLSPILQPQRTPPSLTKTKEPTQEVIDVPSSEDDASELSMSPLPHQSTVIAPTTTAATRDEEEEEVIVEPLLQSPTSGHKLRDGSNNTIVDAAKSSYTSKRPMLSPNLKIDRKRLDSKMTPGKVMVQASDNITNSSSSVFIASVGKEKDECHDSVLVVEDKADDIIGLGSVPEEDPSGVAGIAIDSQSNNVSSDPAKASPDEIETQLVVSRRSRRQRTLTDRFTIVAHTAGGRYLPVEAPSPTKVVPRKSRQQKKISSRSRSAGASGVAVAAESNAHQSDASSENDEEMRGGMIDSGGDRVTGAGHVKPTTQETTAFESSSKANDNRFALGRRSQRERKQTDFLTIESNEQSSYRVGDEHLFNDDEQSDATSLSSVSSVHSIAEADQLAQVNADSNFDNSTEPSRDDDVPMIQPGAAEDAVPVKKEKRRLRVVRRKPLPANKMPVHVNNVSCDDSSWTAAQVEQLRGAHGRVNPLSSTFWFDISSAVDGKSSLECQKFWWSLVQTPKIPKQNKRTTKQPTNRQDVAEDDMFDATPMRGLLLPEIEADANKTERSSAMEVDFGSALKVDSRAVSIAAASRASEGESNFEPLQSKPKLGYKSYLLNMKRDMMRSQKEAKGKKKKKATKYVEKGPRTLSDAVIDADVDMCAQLTPGGTLKVQNKFEDDNDFWNDMYDAEDEEDQW